MIIRLQQVNDYMIIIRLQEVDDHQGYKMRVCKQMYSNSGEKEKKPS